MKGPPNKPKSGKAFTLYATYAMLTYKDVGLEKDEILILADKKLSDVNGLPLYFGLAVSEEKYKNGEHHFHVWIGCNQRTKFTMAELDEIGGVHGHYKEITQTPKRALSYIMKDGNYLLKAGSGGFEEYAEDAVKIYANGGNSVDAIVRRLEQPDLGIKPRNFKQYKLEQLHACLSMPDLEQTL